MQAMKIKNKLNRLLLIWITRFNWIHTIKTTKSNNAPNVNGKAFFVRLRLLAFNPFFKCNHPVKLCCPMKYIPNEINKGN